MPKHTRLHITPLNPQILPVVLPPPILQQASNISFHAIQTSPEKNYGYVDLPEVEAARIRKKLHGSVLKGSKMRVEEARPKRASKENDEIKEPGLNTLETKIGRGKKSRVREEGVITGHELQDRKVRRGWTEPLSTKAEPSGRKRVNPDKKSKPKPSSLTGEAECLFKTTLPPNRIPTDEASVKKRKRGVSHRKVIVHEFANTTKHPSFLRDDLDTDSMKSTCVYVEGRGWVDSNGNVVDTGPETRRTKAKQDGNHRSQSTKDANTPSRRSSRLEPPSFLVTGPKSCGAQSESAVLDDETSSSGTSLTSKSDDEASETGPSPSRRSKGRNVVELGSVERLSITRSSASPQPAQNLNPTSTPATGDIHPLEALFKRPNNVASRAPRKPALEVSTSFNFPEADADESGSQALLLPQTPFTQQDLRQRRQRSAAPTPDTAAPGKTFGDLWEGNSDVSAEDDDAEAEDTPEGKGNEATAQEKSKNTESEFSKWFWEHRGETNRAWKRRRREATKEKRQNDNKERKG